VAGSIACVLGAAGVLAARLLHGQRVGASVLLLMGTGLVLDGFALFVRRPPHATPSARMLRRRVGAAVMVGGAAVVTLAVTAGWMVGW
jgi:uncharacterized membrane protein